MKRSEVTFTLILNPQVGSLAWYRNQINTREKNKTKQRSLLNFYVLSSQESEMTNASTKRIVSPWKGDRAHGCLGWDNKLAGAARKQMGEGLEIPECSSEVWRNFLRGSVSLHMQSQAKWPLQELQCHRRCHLKFPAHQLCVWDGEFGYSQWQWNKVLLRQKTHLTAIRSVCIL